jgi:ketosteroid isomerase-like protein
MILAGDQRDRLREDGMSERNDATEDNRRAVRGAFEAWQDGERPITDLFAPEMVWRIEGRSAASREYGSTQEFVDEVLSPFGARFAASATPFRPRRIRSVHADGDTVIVLWDGYGVANDGLPYENTYAWFLRLAGGKVVDGTAFYDSIAFDELWERVS